MLEALIGKFAQIEDPRCDWRVEHKLLDTLMSAPLSGRLRASRTSPFTAAANATGSAASSHYRLVYPRTTPFAGC
jgi:hypothetical protein